MSVPGYTPGSWWVGVTDGGCVALPGEVDSATVVALWTALRDGAGIAELLTDLLRPGIAAVPPFALVDVQGHTVHVVVRGDVVVEVTTGEGPRTLSGAHMTTWSESVLGDAQRVTVRTPGAPGIEVGTTVPLVSGVVRAGQLVVDLTAAEQSGGSTAEAARTTAPVPVAGPIPTPAAIPAPVPVLEPDLEPSPGPVAAPAPALTVVRSDAPRPAVAEQPTEPAVAEPAVAEQPAEDAARPTWPRVRPLRPDGTPVVAQTAADEEHDETSTDPDHRTGATAPLPIVRTTPEVGNGPSAPAATVSSPEPVEDPDGDEGGHGHDHDGLTVLSSDVVALRRQLPEWAGDAVPSLAVPTPRNPAPAKLVLSTGLVVSLNRPVLLGRAPQVTRVSNNEIPRLVTLASPNQDISRTHAEVRMDGEDVVVTDLRSTNGVLLLRQSAGPQRLHPGEPTVVEPGVVVDLGEGATFLVEAGG